MAAVEVLTEQELLALAGLLRVLVLADRQVDVHELDALERVGQKVAEAARIDDPYRSAAPPAMGPDAFRGVFAQASRQLPDNAAVRAAAQRVERQEAREILFTILLEVAASNGIVPEEQALLDWLKAEWGIEPRPLPNAPYR